MADRTSVRYCWSVRAEATVEGLGHLAGLAGRARPVVLAEDRLLPVPAPLALLLPGGGLRRGTTVVVERGVSLLLALLAGPTSAGQWGAVVGLPDLGLAAAHEAGVDLARLALVPAPGEQWAAVTAALIDALDVIAVQPPPQFRPGDARRLVARARERGAVLVPIGSWIEGAEVRLRVETGEWRGLANGSGHLQSRVVDVLATGRGAAARGQRLSCWLPGSGGHMEMLQRDRPAVPVPVAVPVSVPVAPVVEWAGVG